MSYSDCKTICPIDSAQKAQVEHRTRMLIDSLQSDFSCSWPQPLINFDLIGKTAGMYRVKGKHIEIRYNPYIFAKYFEENLRETVAHEVAHYACDHLYRRGSIKPHGSEWRHIVQLLGGQPEVTCNYDLSDIPRKKVKRFRYSCKCATPHFLTSYRHNKILQGRCFYSCNKCGEKLMISGQPY